ncbi:MAG TPA: hypothetical protein DEH78_03450 [Solibacterales bacterium]|nr:hypothetical protein [Bryobacterales bacterium]
MRIALTLVVIAARLGAQAPAAAPEADCHVYAVNLNEAERAIRTFLQNPNAKPEDLKAQAAKSERTLGAFKAPIAEELTTTKSFPFPGTKLTVTATFFYTDETMAFAESLWLGLYTGRRAVANALTEPGASIVEVNFDIYTYKVLAKQRMVLDGEPWVIGLQCQTMTDEERRKRLSPTGAAAPPRPGAVP